MDALPGPVTNRTRFMPTRVSSSTTYCTTGLRPTGSISLGCDLVAGSSRVPRPATGTTAISMSIPSPGPDDKPIIVDLSVPGYRTLELRRCLVLENAPTRLGCWIRFGFDASDGRLTTEMPWRAD